MSLVIEECKISGYPARTRENIVNSDLTIALAVNFDSAGEKLTKRLCKELDKPYIAIDLNNTVITEERVIGICNKINSFGFKFIRLNIAGNGIYSLPESQEFYNGFLVRLINLINKGIKGTIVEIRSGGQTGTDEAGIIAAFILDLPRIVLAPKGWLFRNKEGIDIRDEKLFKARFK